MQFKSFMEALKGDQHKLDKNKNGKVDAHDFKLLRKEEDDIEEDVDRVERADFKTNPSGRKSHKQITFKNGEQEPTPQREERSMTDAEMKKREEYVKGMKKNISGFKAKYGDRAKDVMYATATKMAMKEESVEEAVKRTATGLVHTKDDYAGNPSTFKDKEQNKLMTAQDRHRMNKAIPSNDKLKEELDEAMINGREYASHGLMHPDHAAHAVHKVTGQSVDFYAHGTGDKVEGKVIKNDGKSVHIKDTKGTTHKFKVQRGLPKQQNEQAPVAPSLVKHRISVTVSEPDHTMVSKRKEKVQKTVIVTHSDNKEGAQKVGEKFYKKKGYRVHDSHHAGMVNEEVEQIDELSKGLVRTYLNRADPSQHLRNSEKETPGILNDPTKLPQYKKKVKSGVGRALNRLTKEEVEQIDEITSIPIHKIKVGSNVTLHPTTRGGPEEKGKVVGKDHENVHIEYKDMLGGKRVKVLHHSFVKEETEIEENHLMDYRRYTQAAKNAKSKGDHDIAKDAEQKASKAASNYTRVTGKKPTFNEETDTSEKNQMAETQLHFIQYAAEEITGFIKMGGKIEEWYQNKLSKVHSDMESLHSYMEGESRRTGMKEEVDLNEDAYAKSEENKRSADSAKKQGNMFDYHMHMADHHENLAQHHSEKGRSNVADQHSAKSEQHHEKAMALKEEVESIDEISSKLAGNYYGAATKKHIDKVGIKPNMYGRIEKDMGAKRKAGVDRAMDRITGARKTNEETNQFDEEGNLMSEKLKFSDFIAKINEQLLEYESDDSGVYRHTKKATYGTSYQGDDDEDDKPKKPAVDAPKRGRGRPAGSTGASYKPRSAETKAAAAAKAAATKAANKNK